MNSQQKVAVSDDPTFLRTLFQEESPPLFARMFSIFTYIYIWVCRRLAILCAMTQARLGREAIAAAAAGGAACPEASVRAASPARWKPGLDLKETEGSDGRRGGEGRHEKGEVEKLVGKGGDEEDEVEIVTGVDENGRPLRAGKAELMREDLKSG